MKKYLFGLFAIALAIGFSSFQMKKTTFSARFIYGGPSFSQGNVQTLSYWTIDNTTTCSDNQNKPCTFTVTDETYSDGTNPTGVTIVTSGSGNNYVLDVLDGTTSVGSSIVNKN